MDLTRLRQGDKVAAIAGILLFIFMFFSWFGLPNELEQAAEQANKIAEQFGAPTVDTGSANINAWESFSFIDLVLFLTVVAAVALAAIRASRNRIELPVPMSVVVTALGALSTLLVLYRVIDPVGDASRKVGLFLGLLAAAAVTVGGYLAMQEEGTSFGDAADRLGDGGRDRGERGDRGPRDRGPGAPPRGDEPPSAPPPPPPPSSGAPPPSGGTPSA